MEVGKFVIGLLIVSSILIGSGTFMIGMTKNYGVSQMYNDTYFTKTYNVLNDTYSITEDMSQSVEQKKTDVLSVAFESAVLFKDTAILLLKVPDLFDAIYWDSIAMANIIIPPWFSQLIIFSFSITMLLLIVSALLRWKMT